MGVSIYLRQVPYSGREPTTGGRMARHALAQASGDVGHALGQIGGGLQRMGAQLQARQKEDLDREAVVNELKAETTLDDQFRTFSHDANQISLTDANGLLQHHTITDYWRGGWTDANGQEHEGYDSLKQSLAEALPQHRRALWLARIEKGPEQQYQALIEDKGRKLREEYITSVAQGIIFVPGRQGDLEAAERAREKITALLPDKDDFAEVAYEADKTLALGLARTDEEGALKYVAKYIPAPQRAAVSAAVQSVARSSELERRRLAQMEQERNNQGLQAKIHSWLAGESAKPDVGEILFLEENGLIDASIGKWAMDEMLKDTEKAIDSEMHGSAYEFMETALEALQEQPPTLSRKRWYEMRNEAAPYLTSQELAIFDSRANAKPGSDPESPLRKEARALATETMGLRYPDPKLSPKEQEKEAAAELPYTLQRDNAVTAVMQQLEDWSRNQREQGKPVSDKEYRAKATQILGKVYRDSYAKPEQRPTLSQRASDALKKFGEQGVVVPESMAFGGPQSPRAEKEAKENAPRLKEEKAKLEADWADVDVDKELDYLPEYYRRKTKIWLSQFRDKRARLDALKKRVPRPAEGQTATIVPLEGGDR